MTRPDLSPRQRDVLREYLDSGNLKEAAHRLGVSPHTAKQHLLNARGRLGAATVAQLAFAAGRRGWFEEPDPGPEPIVSEWQL